MKKSEVLNIIKDFNGRVDIILENEWKLIVRKDVKNLHYGTVGYYKVINTHNVDKWEDFETLDEAIKYFMKKVSYFKSMRRKKNMDSEVSYEVLPKDKYSDGGKVKKIKSNNWFSSELSFLNW